MPYEEGQNMCVDDGVRAAEALLEGKRVGLECAIEALETVGYRVYQDNRGRYRVAHLSAPTTAPPNEPYANTRTDIESMLEDYPPVLSAEQAAEILGVSTRTVSRLCANSKLPSFRVGIKIRIPKHALIEHMSSPRED